MVAPEPPVAVAAAVGDEEEACRASPMAPGTFMPLTVNAARVAAVT